MTNKITTIRSKDSGLTWINIVNAGKPEIDYLRRKFKFKDLDLEDSYAKRYAQRPKYHLRTHYAFLILQFPIYNLKTKTVSTEEIDFFLTHNHLITIHKNKLEPLKTIFHDCDKNIFHRTQCMGDSSGYLLYELVLALQQYTYPILDKLSIDISTIEEHIFEDQEKQMIKEISYLKKNIFDSRRILQAHKNALQKIMQEKTKFFPADSLTIYYSDLIEHSKSIWDILESQKQMLESLEHTNTSLVSSKLNGIMKVLTIFSVIVFPLTLLAAIFGMNTIKGMPFINNPNGFGIIIVIMFFGTIGMFLFFKLKKWL